jgi:dihydroflavonol-4-reductase
MILVTGATGHLGSHLLYELVKANRSVRALYRDRNKLAFVRKIFSYYQPDDPELFSSIEWVQADINDYLTLTECMKDVKQVYHIAGLVSFNDSNSKQLNLINTKGTSNIVNACCEAGVGKLCHVSSIATLGEISVTKWFMKTRYGIRAPRHQHMPSVSSGVKWKYGEVFTKD